MESIPHISVIIPHLNQPEALGRCLASLEAQTYPRAQFEVIVVDNGSANMPQEIVAGYAGVALLREEEPGPGPARNHGVAYAKGAICAFIDSDCLADDGWLARIDEYFTDNANAKILGGDVHIARADPDRLTDIEAYESIYAYRMKEYIARQGFTGTGNLAIRRSILDEVGPFAGIGVAEDRDWGQRATGLGHATTYVEGMIVYHPARDTFEELTQKWDRHISHDYARHAKGLSGKASWLARAAAVAISPLPEIWRIARSPRVEGLMARLKAFVVLVRIRLYRAWVMTSLALGRDASKMSGSWNRG